MHDTLPRSDRAGHLLRADVRPRMAKADLRKADGAFWRVRIGRVIERTRMLAGLSLKEFAAAIKRDERQIARWITGVERMQLDAVLAVDGVRGHFIEALAEAAHDEVDVVTVIQVRRKAVS